MKRVVVPLVTVALSVFSSAIQAAWPEQSVKVIVPFPAGGPADNAMRILGKRLGERWGQPVIVENRSGAPGMVAAAAAAPDGYTLVVGAGSHIVTAPLMNTKLAYKPQRDFAAVSLLLTNTPILTVHPSLNIKTLRELIAYAKSKPGELNYSRQASAAPTIS